MQKEAVGAPGLGVVAGDVLALRGAGLAAAETWALLCQAAQALQDLFLSNGGVVGGSRIGPVVTPNTLELTPRGRVTLRLAPPDTARAYLPPEYRPGRVYSDTDSEKMWMYSLGRALLDTTPRVAALTGTVSVSPSSALQSVLAAMTEPDPHRRASLMNLLDVISEYCRTRLQSKPFTHIVMDMYREVIRSAQYSARKRAALQVPQAMFLPSQQQSQHLQAHAQQVPAHQSKYQAKGALFRVQSRNSRSHPNLLSLSGCGTSLGSSKPEFQSQLNVKTSHGPSEVHHARTSSQPEYSERSRVLSQARSSNNLLMIAADLGSAQSPANVYSDPIYTLPVKPFLSSQDVRVNGLSAVSNRRSDIYAQPARGNRGNGGSSRPDVAHLARTSNGHRQRDNEEIYAKLTGSSRTSQTTLHQRQRANCVQLTVRNREIGFGHSSQPDVASGQLKVYGTGIGQNGVSIYGTRKVRPSYEQQQNPASSVKMQSTSVHGPVPPKPPRIITTLKKVVPSSGSDAESVPPVKPPRNAIKNGPRARRGKAVQRAPSRLYGAIGGPARSFNKTQCVGPEFVVRASQPPKQLSVGDVKTGSVGRIVVILLNGQRLEVTCDSQKITAGELFQAIVQAEALDENFTLGLAALLAGDFAMLPSDTKLNKVAPPGWLNNGKSKGLLGLPTNFMLYLRMRFFLPSLRGTRSWISKHLLYLQIRRCILEQQLICPLAQLINLTGLALQAEFGNYSANEHGCGDYFLLEHYIPESLILNPDQHQSQQLLGGVEALRAQLHRAHRDRRGLDANKAEEMFIAHAQALPDYGAHYYIATVDLKELGKVVACQEKNHGDRIADKLYVETENIYELDKSPEYLIYGKDEFPRLGSNEEILRIPYTDEQKMKLSKRASLSEDIYANPKNPVKLEKTEPNNNKLAAKSKRTESNVWLAVHSQGLKLFDRGGRPRDRIELARFQWRDIQTLSYSKSCLVVHSRLNGKRCKFKLRMDHRKSYFAFKLTSLHHQFFLKLRSELTSLQGLATDFGVPLIVEPNSPPPKIKPDNSKTKISIANTVKKQQNLKCPMQLEEYQNKENENPQKELINSQPRNKTPVIEPICYTPEEDALYAQVHARLEPEGQSRDTEDESDRGLTVRNERISNDDETTSKATLDDNLYSYPNLRLTTDNGCVYSLPKSVSSNDNELLTADRSEKPEELYAAINKSGLSKKNEFPVPEEVWDVTDMKKTLHKVKTSSLPNYGTPRQISGFRTPSLPRRLGVKMGTRAIYSSSLVQRDPTLTDDLESLSLKSDTASSIQSTSAQSTESPMPEAYVLNADIRTNDETFRIPDDETMSESLAARLEALSFAEERILHTIKLERGHGGSIGLQVTEGNDGGVYVQAVSVGGSADMAGNVNKGDRIVAINGQSLLNLRYEDALKMLQSSSETVELVLSQITTKQNFDSKENFDPWQNRDQESSENNYLQNIRFDIASETDSSIMTTKWLAHKTPDVSSVQNTSSAYSSAASSAMDNHNANSLYLTDVARANNFSSASMLLSIEDFDLSRTSHEVAARPPVPPRRRKRKNEPLRKAEMAKGTPASNLGFGPNRKPRLPPPPPPPQISHDRKPPFVNNCHSRPIAPVKLDSNNVEMRYDVNSKSAVAVDEETAKAVTFSARSLDSAGRTRLVISGEKISERNASTGQQQRHPELIGFLSEKTRSGLDEKVLGSFRLKSAESDKYPPLFFTLQDFCSVMNDSRSSEKERLNIEEEEKCTLTTFSEDFSDRSDENVCFRVTTTNVPFEKCSRNWPGSLGNSDFSFKIDDNSDVKRYTSENLKSERSAPFLFGQDTFDDGDPDDGTVINRSTTRVRFMIDSDSSIPDFADLEADCKVTSDGLRDVEVSADDVEIVGKDRGSLSSLVVSEWSSNAIEQINDNGSIVGSQSDEFDDVPSCALLKTVNDDEKHVVNDNKNANCETRSSRSYACLESHESGFQTFAVKACVEARPVSVIGDDGAKETGDIVERDKRDADDSKNVAVASVANICENSTSSEIDRKSDVMQFEYLNFRSDREVKRSTKTLSEKQLEESKSRATERRKIFIDQSLCDLINDDDDIDWSESTDDEDDKDSSNGTNVLDRRVNLKIEEISDELDAKLCAEDNEDPASENDRQSLSNRSIATDDTSRPRSTSINTNDRNRADIHRNSFLENMLSNDQLELETWKEYAPCKIVAIHSKTTPSSSSSNTESKLVPDCAKIKPEESNDLENHCESLVPKMTRSDTSRVSRLSIVGSSPNGTKTNVRFQKIDRNTVKSENGLRTIEFKGIFVGTDDIEIDVDKIGVIEANDSHNDNARLKTNNNRNVDSILDECIVKHSVNEEPIGSWTAFREESRDGTVAYGKKKTDEPVDKYSKSSIRAKQTELGYESALEIDTTDKRAIDRNTPTIRCSNDDNNAVTPVAVRYSQSNGSVSITPNSIRSFVKQHETGENSEESNDVVSVTEKVTKVKETRRSRDDEEKFVARRESEEKSALSCKGKVDVDWAGKIDNEVGYTIVRRETMSSWNSIGNSLDVSDGSVIVGKSEFFESRGQRNVTCDPRKIECEIGEQFVRGESVLNSSCGLDESLMNSAGSIIGTKLKRKAPGEPTLEMETVDRGEEVGLENGRIVVNSGAVKIEGKVDRLTTRRFDNSLPCDQEHAGAEDQDGTVRSGIENLVPKSTSTQFDQPFVFYCTV